ncbi:MAG: ATP-binding protein [Halobacteria archaeon]
MLKEYDSVGVKSLSGFSIFWGFNYILNSIVVWILMKYGVTSGAALKSLSFTGSTELFLIGTSSIRGLLTVLGIFSWLWFVLKYTTRIDHRDLVAVFSLAFTVFVVAGINGLIGGLEAFQYIGPSGTYSGGIHGFIGVIEIIGTGVAIGAGTALLYRTSRRHVTFTRRETVALTVPVLLPYLVRYLYQFGIVPDFQTIQMLRVVALGIGLAGLVLATRRYCIFDSIPASRAIGHDTVFQASKSAITVVDEKERISNMNKAAVELFGISPEAGIGTQLSEILPETVGTDSLNPSGSTVFRIPEKETVVEAEIKKKDQVGRNLGKTVVYHDIMDERRRRQRIQVLNRVLRHNLRNDITVATGYADGIAEGGIEPEEGIRHIRESLSDIASIGDKAREIENMLNADPSNDEPRPLSSLVQHTVKEVRKEHPDVSVQVSVSEKETYANSKVLEPVLTELLINGIEHTDCEKILVSFDPETYRLSVEDEGPGLPEYELEVFRTEEETPLKHGSGMGLWLVKWGVNQLGGEVRFDVDDSGTKAILELPEHLFGD